MSTEMKLSDNLPDPTPQDVTSDLPPPADNISVCSSEEMDIDPLFSSSEDSDDENTPPAPPTHTPLFLKVTFVIKNKATKEEVKLSHDFTSRPHDLKGNPNYIMDVAPLCMSEYSVVFTI